MRRWHWIVGLLICLTGWPDSAVWAQLTTTLSGHVVDAATGKPMPFANVYLNGSTRGTLTNDQGYFSLTGVPLGTVEIVASFVGYEPMRRTLRFDDDQPKTITFRLKPGGQTLATVTVRGNLKKWQRQLKQFKKQLLGEPFGGQCEITNSDVLSFKEEDGHLKAMATEPLVIENHALGYKLWYDMLYFDASYRKVYYAGSTRFEEMKPQDERQASRFRRNRMRAYIGSTRHLMATLVDSTYEKAGFLVYQEEVTVPPARTAANRMTLAGSVGAKGHLVPLSIRNLIQPGRLPFERMLVSSKPLVVFYTNSMSAYSPYIDARYAYSQIKLPNRQMQLTTDGSITLPYGAEIEGSLADDRLSTMLPDDWRPDKNQAAEATILAQGKLLPPDARLNRIATAFKEQFQTLAPVVYMHIDKPFYATGDRIWFSTYLLDAGTNRRPAGETAIHVDLLTSSGKPVQHQWVKITDGRAEGDFRLSDSLASGTYQLRAYTDEDIAQHRPAFERPIAVYNLLRGSTSTTGSDTLHRSLDIQLLPEGGRWLVGVPSRLGIKAVAPDGLGRMVSGAIVDDSGQEVARFTTNSLGLGSLVMTPVQGRTYRAQAMALHTGRSHRLVGSVVLPAAETNGFALATDVVSDSTQLMLMITGTNRTPVDSVYILIQQQGRLVDQRKIQLQNGAARIGLPVALLPAGLNQITLYDASARPQAERLVFLPERIPPLKLLLGLNKTRYKPREQAILSINLSDDGIPSVAALSASVTDAGQIPEDTAAATMQTHLLLTGELRGRVEQPNLYFTDNSPEIRRALDDLLLTQGWRRVSGTAADDQLGGVSLMGKIVNQKKQPMPGAQIMVASTVADRSFVKSAGADEHGRFRLAGLNIADTMQVLVQLMNRELKPFLKDEAQLLLDSPAKAWKTDTVNALLLPNWQALRAQIDAARVRQEDDAEFYRDKTAKVLKEVTVRARKVDDRPDDIQRRSLHNTADAVLLFDDKSPRFTNLYEMIRGRFAGVTVGQTQTGGYSVIVRGLGTINSSPQALFLLDGVPIQDTDGTSLLAFNPGDIERVELLKNAGTAGIYGVRGGNGVIAFYTKVFRPGQPSEDKKNGAKPMQLIGYASVQREFYVPRYESKPDDMQPSLTARIDRRDVLYWKPIIQTDGQGHSQLQFPISDVVRTVRVTVQGITNDGRPVFGTTLIQVQ